MAFNETRINKRLRLSFMNIGGIRMLARNVMGDDWEIRHASCCCHNIAKKKEELHWHHVFPLLRPVNSHKPCFCNLIYLPTPLPSIFCYSKEGALRLANPYVPFLFLWIFLLIFYLRQALLLPRPHIKQLGTFILYLTTLSAKIELFGQISFSNLQQKIETWDDPA